MKKQKEIENGYEQLEGELMCEDGIFSARHRTVYDCADRCAACGFELLPGEDTLQIIANGDVIHGACWSEYAEENTRFFCRELSEDCDGFPGEGVFI